MVSYTSKIVFVAEQSSRPRPAPSPRSAKTTKTRSPSPNSHFGRAPIVRTEQARHNLQPRSWDIFQVYF